MEFKKTTYEFIEMYPNTLRHKIPLIQILMAVTYYATYPFIFIYLLVKKGMSLFSSIELTKGAEENSLAYHFDLKTLEPIELEKENVLKTESIYYSITDSKEIAKELNEKGYNVFENIGGKYKIKKRTEFCEDLNEDKEYVIISVPKIAITIHSIFNTLKLL